MVASPSLPMKNIPEGAWSWSREQFLHRGLRKFRHSKSSVYRWYPQLVCSRFVYDTYRTMEATRSRHGWVHMFITHCPTVTLQLYNFDLFRICRTSSFCTVAWQLARFQLTRRIARSLGDIAELLVTFWYSRKRFYQYAECINRHTPAFWEEAPRSLAGVTLHACWGTAPRQHLPSTIF